MGTAHHGAAAAAAALMLVLLVAQAAAFPSAGQGRRMTDGAFRESGAATVAVAGAPDTGDASISAVKPADQVSAAATSSVATDNAYDLCYNLNQNRTLAFADVAYWQGSYLRSNQFIADTTCFLQWLPIRTVNITGVGAVPLSCECLNTATCGQPRQQPCCKKVQGWSAATNWALASSYVWRSTPNQGNGYVCEWVQTRPVPGYGIMIASTSYSVVTL